MIAFRTTKMVVMLVVGVWVARYLGPSTFGVLSFGMAWVSLFAIFAKLGLENIVDDVRTLLRRYEMRYLHLVQRNVLAEENVHSNAVHCFRFT